MEIPAENNGKVKEVFVKAGDKVKTGSPLISLEVSSDVKSSIKPEVKEDKEEPTFEKEEVKLKEKPDCLLILAWNFFKEIKFIIFCSKI